MGNPLHFALVVGISKYPWGYSPLQGPVNDAREFARWATSPSGGDVPTQNVARCITPARGAMTREKARPTKESIDKKLWLLRAKAQAAYGALPEEERAQAREASRLYIYVAGHGIMPGGGVAALLDALAEPARRTNLELSKYGSWFQRDGAFAEVCIFADCCRNFEFLAEPRGPDFDPPAQLGGRVFALVGYATTAGELAREETERYDPDVPDDQRRGYFSRALIEGLKGKATNPHTGYVTAASLAVYVHDQVWSRTKNRPAHHQQTIEMPVNLSHDMTFGPKRRFRQRRVQRHQVVIHFPPGFGGDVELVAPDDATSRWRAADGPWTVRASDGIWTVQHADTERDTTGFAEDGLFRVSGADRDVQL
jgi:Caspase domain